MNRFVRISGWFNLSGSVLLLLSWLALGVFNFRSITNGSFIDMFSGGTNVFSLLLLFASMLLVLVGFVGIFLYVDNNRWYSIVGFISFFIGLAWFTSIQYYETFIFPFLAAKNPIVFDVILKGKDAMIFGGYLASGLPWTLGLVLFGIALIKTESFRRPFSFVWIIGGMLQLFGAIPVRTLGFFFIAFSIFYFGLKLIKRT